MVSLSDQGDPYVQGAVGVLERPDVGGNDGDIVVFLVDTTQAPAARLATTRTEEILDVELTFKITRTGYPCQVTLDDSGPPLFTIPTRNRHRVNTGETVVLRLPVTP